MIDIKHLKTISTLKETGSLVNTARELFLTQSALSHQIKDLENKLDCQLFERKTQPDSIPKCTGWIRRNYRYVFQRHGCVISASCKEANISNPLILYV